MPLPDKPSIAVLPFENMTGDPKQEYFTDGFTEQIITSLSKISSLFVISRNSSFTYKGKPVKLKKVSKELGVRYVLEGSIQKSGDRVRINAQLIDAVSDQHLWAENYDRDMKDIFALQDEIILKILTALQVNLTSGEDGRVWAKGTKNLEAYLKLMQARENFLKGDEAGTARARQLIEETIALDPRYAQAYMYMGATHIQDFLLGSANPPRNPWRRGSNGCKRRWPWTTRWRKPTPGWATSIRSSTGTKKPLPKRRRPWRWTPIPRRCITWRVSSSVSPESRRNRSRRARSRSASSPSPPASTTGTWGWPISRTAPIARKRSRRSRRDWSARPTG